MPTLKAAFSQRKWRISFGFNGEGFCYSLVADWCAQILANVPRQKWGVPATLAVDRMKRFLTPQVAGKIAGNQNVYTQRTDILKHNVSMLQMMILVSQHGSLNCVDRGNLISVGLGVKDENLTMGVKNLETAMRTLGVRSTDEVSCTVTTCHKDLKAKCAYVLKFRTKGGAHAIGIYKTGGLVSHDYLVFDPNFGEYYCTGEEDLTGLMQKIKDCYNPSAVFLVQVVLH